MTIMYVDEIVEKIVDPKNTELVFENKNHADCLKTGKANILFRLLGILRRMVGGTN